ncbi:hypothetical protein NEOLEDRAFT_1138969 [Neolentinus lepideus HHB14362 ss-1]|uniref:Uncharacterized protein n=1 Tax=Neolentinus lepideus HHB14362 ss-1 TaxID=1314782 RepID=A0A165Q0U0_9AGAM|nr:hypothetical protein NEOLEDRAFT_1138969 [Neolentinus lepideus HHB14362 ss-1]
MSSTASAGATATAVASSSSTGSSSPGLASSSSLYLYTFLATLILLLSISAAIVFRSLIIRQRHRRLIQQAILDGTYVPGVFPPPPGGRGRLGGRERKELGPKPVMYEAWTVLPGESFSYGMDEKVIGEWETLMPVSAALVNPTVQGLEPPIVPTSPSLPPVSQRRPFLSRLRSSRRTNPAMPSSPQTIELTEPISSQPPPYSSQIPTSPTPLSSAIQEPTATPVRMTFLIAMPSPNPLSHPPLHHRPLSTATASSFGSDIKGKEKVQMGMAAVEEEGEVPVVEFGVVEVRVEGGVQQ